MYVEYKFAAIEKYLKAVSDKIFEDYLRYGVLASVSQHVIKSILESEHYIWRAKEDDRVRKEHVDNNGKIFEYNQPPPTGNPGQARGCRCWAEPVFATTDNYFVEALVRMDNTATWPTPPINGALIEGEPSKLKFRTRGERSLYDQYGGEWRCDLQDKRHNFHWDYKARGRCSKWLNIRINNVITLKKEYQYVENKVFSQFQTRGTIRCSSG
jgi:hypothetical protein